MITAIQNAETAGEAYTLALPGGDVVLNPGDYQISSEDMPGWLVASEGALTIALDVELTDDLRREGVARELVNRIQNLRKTAGFEVTDRIDTVIYANAPEIAPALAAFGEWIGSQTLSRSGPRGGVDRRHHSNRSKTLNDRYDGREHQNPLF